MRASKDGVLVYGRDGLRQIVLRRGEGMPGRQEVLDDMAAAIRTGKKPVHDGCWGKATVEVALAILRSSREGCESRWNIRWRWTMRRVRYRESPKSGPGSLT